MVTPVRVGGAPLGSMPDGGQGRDLITLLGGPGTINVASWAPDSTRFA